MSDVIKVFLCEDEVIIRQAIKKTIHWEREGYELAGEAGDGETAFPLISETKPDILIMDDSASALDFATDAALRKAVKELGSMTIFIVSQRASNVMEADRILVLDDGELVGNGKHDELLRSCKVYSDIYSTQFGSEEAGK